MYILLKMFSIIMDSLRKAKKEFVIVLNEYKTYNKFLFARDKFMPETHGLT